MQNRSKETIDRKQVKGVPISVFDLLDTIRETNGINYGVWAEHSLLPQARISELKRISKLAKKGEGAKNVGREFSLVKCTLLINGLRSYLGNGTLINEISRNLDTLKSKRDRILVMTLTLPVDKDDLLESYLRSLLLASVTAPTTREAEWLGRIDRLKKRGVNFGDILGKIEKAHQQHINIASILDAILTKK